MEKRKYSSVVKNSSKMIYARIRLVCNIWFGLMMVLVLRFARDQVLYLLIMFSSHF
jgi:hypothetical protein